VSIKVKTDKGTEAIPIFYNSALTVCSAVIASIFCILGLFTVTLHLFSGRLSEFLEAQHKSVKRTKPQRLSTPRNSSAMLISKTTSISDLLESSAQKRMTTTQMIKDLLIRRTLGDSERPSIIQILIGAIFTAAGVCIMV
jgi:hypothetical protein